MNSEPYALRTIEGLEVMSNDRQMKYIARRSVDLSGAMEQSFLAVYCYVKDGTGWERTDTVGIYSDEVEFLGTLEQAPEFSKAMKELDS